MTGTSQSVVDTNIIVRFLVRDDELLYQNAAAIMTSILEGRQTAFIPDIVIAECVYVLQRLYKVPRTEIAGHLRALMSYPGVMSYDRNTVIHALNLYEQNNVSFVDAMCVAIATGRGCTLATFDKRLTKLVAKLANPK